MLLAHTLAIKLSSVALVFLSSQLQIKMQKADNFLYFKNLKNSVFEILIFGTCDQVKKIGWVGGSVFFSANVCGYFHKRSDFSTFVCGKISSDSVEKGKFAN